MTPLDQCTAVDLLARYLDLEEKYATGNISLKWYAAMHLHLRRDIQKFMKIEVPAKPAEQSNA